MQYGHKAHGEVEVSTHWGARAVIIIYCHRMKRNPIVIINSPVYPSMAPALPMFIHGAKPIQQLATTPSNADECSLSRGRMRFPSGLWLLLGSEMVIGGRTEFLTLHVCQGRLCILSVDPSKSVAINRCFLEQSWAETCPGVDCRRGSGLKLGVLYRPRHGHGLGNSSNLVCRRSWDSDDLFTFWRLEAPRRGLGRLDTELNVYSVTVSKTATVESGWIRPDQEPHSPDHGHIRATSSILCNLAIRSQC